MSHKDFKEAVLQQFATQNWKPDPILNKTLFKITNSEDIYEWEVYNQGDNKCYLLYYTFFPFLGLRLYDFEFKLELEISIDELNKGRVSIEHYINEAFYLLAVGPKE